jgi:hypothetical protein
MYSYYRPRYGSPRKSTAVKPQKMATVLGAEIMWGLAAWADRVNGGYVKETERNEQGEVMRERNRDMIRVQVQQGLTDLTDADIEQGRQARRWHQGRLAFKVLRGQALADFERTLSEAVQQEEFSNRADLMHIAVVASQITSYRKGLANEQMMDTVDHSPLADVGSKVSVEATVVRSVYSHNWNVNFVTARTQCNRLVFFSFREALEAGLPIRLRGTVKAHRPDSTQLNRVKLI